MTPEYEKWTEWVCKCGNSYKHRCSSGAQRQWVGLTDEDYKVLREGVVKQGKPIQWMIENIEAKLKEKNT